MFVYIRSAASIIVVTQKLVLQQPKNVTAKCTETLLPPSLYSIFLGVDSVDCGPFGTIMQGKLMRSCILCVHIETSSLCAKFLNKIDVSVFVYYPRKKKAFNFDNFDNSHDRFLWLDRPEYFIDNFYENRFHVRLWHPSCVYFSAQRQYTAVQKMCTPLK